MAYGSFAYGSAAIGGEVITITCGTPRSNLVVMEELLSIGYSYEDASKLINFINNE